MVDPVEIPHAAASCSSRLIRQTPKTSPTSRTVSVALAANFSLRASLLQQMQVLLYIAEKNDQVENGCLMSWSTLQSLLTWVEGRQFRRYPFWTTIVWLTSQVWTNRTHAPQICEPRDDPFSTAFPYWGPLWHIFLKVEILMPMSGMTNRRVPQLARIFSIVRIHIQCEEFQILRDELQRAQGNWKWKHSFVQFDDIPQHGMRPYSLFRRCEYYVPGPYRCEINGCYIDRLGVDTVIKEVARGRKQKTPSLLPWNVELILRGALTAL